MATTSRKSTSKKRAAPKKDAIALLKQDHEKVRGLLSKLEKSADRAGDRAMQLVSEIEGELKVHTQIEEEIFYPAFRDAAKKKDDLKMFYEANEEHHVVDLVMPELQDRQKPEQFAAKAKVLKELVEHHAGEEEKEMFPRARKLMDAAELRDLGERMDQRKKELKAAQ